MRGPGRFLAAEPQCLGQPGADDGRGDTVYPYSRRELEGQLLGDVDQRRLARVVDAEVLRYGDAADRAYVDHRTAVFPHPRTYGERGPHDRRPHVQVEDLR